MRLSVGLCALVLAGCGAATDADIGAELQTTDETERLRAELEQAREEMDRLRAEAEAQPEPEPPVSAPLPTPEAQPEPEAAPEPEIEAPPEPEPEEEETAAPEPPPEVEVEIIEVAPPLSTPLQPPPPEPEPEPLPPPEPPAVCGDGVVSAGEVCEPERNPDGTFQAPWPGRCNHLCSAVYQEKLIRRTLHNTPNLGGVAGADALCQADWGPNYKALIVDGHTRVASESPNLGDGQVGWVLQSWTFYRDASTAYPDPRTLFPLVWVTESIALLGVHDDSTEREYHPDIDTSRLEGETHWAGYRADWTTGETCGDWTIDDGRATHRGSTPFWSPSRQEWRTFDGACLAGPTYLRCVEQ